MLDAIFLAIVFKTEKDSSKTLDDHSIGRDFDHDSNLLREVTDFFSSLTEQLGKDFKFSFGSNENVEPTLIFGVSVGLNVGF